ncbi:Kinase [Hexamita inflata]|uniref:non-specific serine/threonine protein kinase n=1 Tax=Hexamita inflata TaxID=28002 RepID=A0ABP1MCX3_9EUKA
MSKLDVYEEIRQLGRGAFGEAILYRDKKTHKKYVIKKFKMHSMEWIKNKEAAAMEASILNKLSHPNIIGYREQFTFVEYFYIVMEYADSGDLSQLISERAKAKQPFSETEVMQYFVQILLALKHIHDHQIIHRDIRPQNIYLNTDAENKQAKRQLIKLGDFGTSIELSTQPNQMVYAQVGSPYYISPEIIQECGYNDKADIWSLGCVLYELCTFNRVFTGSSLYTVFQNINSQQHTPINNSRYSQNLSNIIDLMLSKNPQQRPSANELLKMPTISQWILSPKQIIDVEFSERSKAKSNFLKKFLILLSSVVLWKFIYYGVPRIIKVDHMKCQQLFKYQQTQQIQVCIQKCYFSIFYTFTAYVYLKLICWQLPYKQKVLLQVMLCYMVHYIFNIIQPIDTIIKIVHNIYHIT